MQPQDHKTPQAQINLMYVVCIPICVAFVLKISKSNSKMQKIEKNYWNDTGIVRQRERLVRRRCERGSHCVRADVPRLQLCLRDVPPCAAERAAGQCQLLLQVRCAPPLLLQINENSQQGCAWHILETSCDLTRGVFIVALLKPKQWEGSSGHADAPAACQNPVVSVSDDP